MHESTLSDLGEAFDSLLPLTRSAQRWIILPTTNPNWCAVFDNTGERDPNLAARLSRTGVIQVVECDGHLANPKISSFYWAIEKMGKVSRRIWSIKGTTLAPYGKPHPFEEEEMTVHNLSDELFLANFARGGFFPHRDSFYLQDGSSGIGLSREWDRPLRPPSTSLAAARKRRLTRGSVF